MLSAWEPDQSNDATDLTWLWYTVDDRATVLRTAVRRLSGSVRRRGTMPAVPALWGERMDYSLSNFLPSVSHHVSRVSSRRVARYAVVHVRWFDALVDYIMPQCLHYTVVFVVTLQRTHHTSWTSYHPALCFSSSVIFLLVDAFVGLNWLAFS